MPEIRQLFSSPRCQHVHYSGRPCKAPARRGRNFCVFHQAAHLDPGGCNIPVVEDLHSYQIAVIRIMQSLAADAIDSKKATALLYALQLLGGKLNDFVSQREEVENPAVALKKELTARYDARKHPFPSFIPEKDVIAILKEMRAEELAEPNDAIEVIPQQPDCPERFGIRNASVSAVIPSGGAGERSEPVPESRKLEVLNPPGSSVPSVLKKAPAGVVDKLEACDDSASRSSSPGPRPRLPRASGLAPRASP